MGVAESVLEDPVAPDTAHEGGEASDHRSDSRAPAQRRQIPNGSRSANHNNDGQRRPPRQAQNLVSNKPTQPAQDLPLFRIHGIILGRASSGKKTLAQRLQGKDPFAAKAGRAKGGNNQSDSQQNEKMQAHGKILKLRYIPPPDAIDIWNRVQLCVQTAGDIKDVSWPRRGSCFLVLLVDPREDSKETMEYIDSCLSRYLRRYAAAHQPEGKQSENQTDENQEQDTTDSKQPQPQRQELPALCVCIISNFRDLQENDSGSDKGELDDRIHQLLLKLRTLVEDIANEHVGSAGHLLIRSFSVSLFNCFGLTALHDFVFQSYLVHKRVEFERQLQTIQQQIERTDNYRKLTPSYELYLKDLNPIKIDIQRKSKSPKQAPAESKRNSGETNDAKPEQLNAPKGRTKERDGRNHADPQRAQVAAEASSKSPQAAPRRYITKPQPSLIGRDALEAFLASDSDDDNEPGGGLGPIDGAGKAQTRNNEFVYGSGSESDDESDSSVLNSSVAQAHTEPPTEEKPPTPDSKIDHQAENRTNKSYEPVEDVEIKSVSEDEEQRESMTTKKGVSFAQNTTGVQDTNKGDSDKSERPIDYERKSAPKQSQSNIDKEGGMAPAASHNDDDVREEVGRKVQITSDEEPQISDEGQNSNIGDGENKHAQLLDEDDLPSIAIENSADSKSLENMLAESDEETEAADALPGSQKDFKGDAHAVDDDDDDDFFIGDQDTQGQLGSEVGPVTTENVPASSLERPASNSTGLSAAALAAIAAAQQEAETMLIQQESNRSKPKKKKKSKEGKKKSKKKKSEEKPQSEGE